MEILFSHNGRLYRVDGCDPKNRGVFWAEEVHWAYTDVSYVSTENYQRFDIKDLAAAQHDALNTALTFISVEED